MVVPLVLLLLDPSTLQFPKFIITQYFPNKTPLLAVQDPLHQLIVFLRQGLVLETDRLDDIQVW